MMLSSIDVLIEFNYLTSDTSFIHASFLSPKNNSFSPLTPNSSSLTFAFVSQSTLVIHNSTLSISQIKVTSTKLTKTSLPILSLLYKLSNFSSTQTIPYIQL